MLRELHTKLGIPQDYGLDGAKAAFDEAAELIDAGVNPSGRMQQLTPEAAVGWETMMAAASADGITLLIVSGFRSVDYQAGLIRKKLHAGQSLSEILQVNAAPGFSEHHTGRAIDIAEPGSTPLTEEFESSGAFRWLEKNASKFGFFLRYPRGNPQGFIYEPWNWAQRA